MFLKVLKTKVVLDCFYWSIFFMLKKLEMDINLDFVQT